MGKNLINLLISNLPSLAAVCGAIYLAVLGKDGWGWFLFVAVLLSLEVNTSTKIISP